MVPELRDVLVLVKELPEKYQKKAAWALQRVVRDHEDSLMTPKQRRRIQELRRKALSEEIERLMHKF